MSLFKNRPLARTALFVFWGSLSAYLLNIGGGMTRAFAPIPLFLIAAALLCSLVFVKKNGIVLLVSIAALFIGYLSQMLYDRHSFSDILALDSGELHHIEARIIDAEAVYSEKSICIVSVTSINEKSARGILTLTVKNGEFTPKENDIISCDIKIVEWADCYLYQQGIAAHAATEDIPKSIGTAKSGLSSTLITWNTALRERLKEGMTKDSANLLSALLLGNREDLAPSVTRDFRRTGLSHLLALSGLHLSILAMFILQILRKIGTPHTISFALLLLFVTFYSTITGFPLSLLRAAGMLLLAELGGLLRLSSDPITSLFASVTIIFLVSPGAVADIGLALSFLATLGILAALNFMPKQDARASRLRRAITKLGFAIIVTITATLFTLLLSVLIFGEISLISPLSNLIISPFLHILLLLGPCALAAPTLFAPIIAVFAGATLKIVSFLSSLPGIYIGASHTAFIIISILFSALLIFLLVDTHITKKALKGCLLSGFAVLLITLASCHIYATSRDYVCYRRLVGGEYMLLQSDCHVTVVDNGGDSYTASTVKSTLKNRHITEIDTLLITRCTPQTPEFITVLTDAVLVHKILLCPSTSEYVDITKHTIDSAGIKIVQAQNGTQALDKNLAITLRSGIQITESSDCFLLRFEHEGTRICYAPALAFATATDDAIESFTSRADLIIVGAEPSFSGVFRADGISQEAMVVIGNTKNAPEAVIERENAVLEPNLYLFPLK